MTIVRQCPPTSSASDHGAALCNKPQASAPTLRWLTSKAARNIDCICDVARKIPNPAYFITSSPGRIFTLLTLAGKCMTDVSASPYTPSSENPTPASVTQQTSSFTIPSTPPYVPPRPLPGWMVELNANDNPPQDNALNEQTGEQISHTTIDHPPPIENLCFEKYIFSPPRDSRLCRGNVFPAHQNRNFLDESLDCRNTEHTYLRHPDPLDLAAWRTKKDKNPNAVADQMRTFPNPVQVGILNYHIDHVWTWEDCQLVEDPFRCGTYQVCKVTERTMGNGQKEVSRKCEDRPRKCYVDVPVESRQPCGQGKIDFTVEFLKKDTGQRYPDYQDYDGVMPKGYELLPGEKETISAKVRNSAGQLTPALHIAEAKNQYTTTLSVNNPQATQLQCRQNGYDNITFKVQTGHRILSYPPAIFSFPDGVASESILWGGEIDVNGLYDTKGYPRGLILQTNGLQIFDAVIASVRGDPKKTVLSAKVELFEPGLLWGEWLRSTAYFNKDTFQCLDEHESNGWSSVCEFNFDEGAGEMIYQTPLPGVIYPLVKSLCSFAPEGYCSKKTPYFRNDLVPDQKYTFKISTGLDLPFYHSESFSLKTLDISFHTNPNVDQRTWQPLLWNMVRSTQYCVLLFGTCRLLTAVFPPSSSAGV